jgi:hypothetical protein
MTPSNSGMIINKDSEVIGSLEDITSEGVGSGLEAERVEDGTDDISAPFDPKLIDVVTQQRTVDLLMTRLGHGELDLSPDFQRRANLWNERQKSALIESMLLRIPIPSLYVSEDEGGNYQVVDGLQRFCAIAHFVNVSHLNKTLGTQLNPMRLKGLQSLKVELEDRTFDELSRPLYRRIMETELTLHVIRAGTPADVKFNIFSRINKGGLPLNSQEIRNAIYRGKWRHYIRQMAVSPPFLSATEGKIKGERLEDHELVIRAIALYSLSDGQTRHPDENLDEFLNDFVEKRSASWNDEKWHEVERTFYRAIEAAPRIFGRIAFRKFSAPNEARRPINRGLFETETAALALRTEAEIKILAERSDQVIDLFAIKFSNDKDFANALLYATGKGWASNKRLDVINAIFREVLHA